MTIRSQNENWMSAFGNQQLITQSANKALSGVYSWMSLGVLVSAVTGFGLINSGIFQMLMTQGRLLPYLVFIAQFVLILVFQAKAETASSSTLKGLFLSYAVLTGFTFALLMVIFPIMNFVTLFAVAAIGFAGLALFGLSTKKDLSFMSTFLFMGLFMAIGAGILNLFLHSQMLSSLQGWIGIIVFSGLTAYDSQRLRSLVYLHAKSSGGQQTVMNRVMIQGALTMYLNFINLFISLLQLFGNKRD